MGRTELPSGNADVATQVGALCYRVRDGEVQVLLVTSRSTRRWIIPKGWPVKGQSLPKAAETEAWEEAGVRGKLGRDCLGFYSYLKLGEAPGTPDVPCIVSVYPLKVKSIEKKYPERRDRQRRWFTPEDAARKVQEPELQRLLAGFDPEAG